MVGKAKQLEFAWPLDPGSVRKSAGRLRQGDSDSARVSHGGRETFSKGHVVHMTCRLEQGLPSLRTARTVELLLAPLLRALGLRLKQDHPGSVRGLGQPGPGGNAGIGGSGWP